MAADTVKRDLLLAFLREVWNEGRTECAADYLASRYTVYHDPGDPWDGKTLDIEGFKERVTLSRAPFPDQVFEVQELLSQGDAVAVTWLWAATHAGDVPGFPASGRRVTMSGATLYYFEGNRIAGHWQVADRLGLIRQLQGRG
jgi:predicted ester cyclase